MKLSARWIGATLATLVLTGAASRGAEPARVHNVSIRGFSFSPAAVAVAVGDTIGWVNADIVIHTVTGDTARWDSGDLTAGRRYMVVAKSKGKLDYHCELHPSMKGTIIVE